MSQNSRSRLLSKPEYVKKLEIKAKRQRTRLQKQGKGVGITEFAVKKTMQILKISERNAESFSIDSKHKQSEWDAYAENLERYLKSPHATKKGRAEIRKKIRNTMTGGKEIGGAEAGETWTLTNKQADALISIFEDDVYSQMKDKYGLTSRETIDISKDYNLTSDDVIEEMNKLIESPNFDRENFYSALTQNLSARASRG